MTRPSVPGLHVSLEQGNRGNHCVPHECFSSQMEKGGKEAVVIKVEISEIKPEKEHTAGPKTANDPT